MLGRIAAASAVPITSSSRILPTRQSALPQHSTASYSPCKFQGPYHTLTYVHMSPAIVRHLPTLLSSACCSGRSKASYVQAVTMLGCAANQSINQPINSSYNAITVSSACSCTYQTWRCVMLKAMHMQRCTMYRQIRPAIQLRQTISCTQHLYPCSHDATATKTASPT
jgi:hypothetical protein